MDNSEHVMEVEKQKEAAGIEPDAEIDAFIKVMLFLSWSWVTLPSLTFQHNSDRCFLTFLFL